MRRFSARRSLAKSHPATPRSTGAAPSAETSVMTEDPALGSRDAPPRLAYTVHPGTGPYLALVHGFLSSQAQWTDNLAALASVCRPVTIDLYGHGHSPAPADRSLYTAGAYVGALQHIHAELGGEPWLVCGYSLGAGLTIRYTQSCPDHVIGHVFTNSQSGFADDALIAQWREQAEESAARIISGGRRAIERIPVHPRYARRLPAEVSRRLREDADRLSPTGVANTLLATNLTASTRDIAGSNPRPALLCFGRHEKRFHASRDWAEAHMANLTVVSLDAGHAVNMEDAAGFNNAVVQFVAALLDP